VYDQCLPNNQPAGQRIGAAFPLLLGFALALAVAASGLVLGVGFQERRRTFAIASALGARSRQLGGFVWSESLFMTVGGLILGTVTAMAISDMLVKVLTGVFDLPPDVLSVPWADLVGAVVLTVGAAGAAGAVTLRPSGAPRSRSSATSSRRLRLLTVPSPALRSFGVVRSPKPRRCHVRAVQA
jgi:predicted lysophospholipase L1 biosynthesis ABC-type transport system permease subunit